MVGMHDVGEVRAYAEEAQDLRAAFFSTTGDISLHGENLGVLQAALLSLYCSSAGWLLPVSSSYA